MRATKYLEKPWSLESQALVLVIGGVLLSSCSRSRTPLGEQVRIDRYQPYSSSELSCTLTAVAPEFSVGDSIKIAIAASSGTYPYFVFGFDPGTDGVVTKQAVIGQGGGDVSVKYSSSGLKSITLDIGDSDSNTALCSLSLSIKSSSIDSGEIAEFFKVGSRFYNITAPGHYCEAVSESLWRYMGASSSSPSYGSIPNGLIKDKDCLIPKGAFRILGSGFYAVGDQYCSFVDINHWKKSSLTGENTKPSWDVAVQLPSIPPSMKSSGDCMLPKGFATFSNFQFRYWINEVGKVCSFSSYALFTSHGGTDEKLTNYTRRPEGIYDGDCKIPVGQFFTLTNSDGSLGGYWAYGPGLYCVFYGMDEWNTATRGLDIFSVPNYTPVPSSMVLVGRCYTAYD